jgi:microcystin degradation protein MlrC
MSPRIAYGRVAQETNALSPVHTTLADFRAMHYVEGDALARAVGRRGEEAAGFLKKAEIRGFVDRARSLGVRELVPTLSAWAVPSGPLDRACFDALTSELCRRLRGAGKLDGLFLALHGSMGVVGRDDPESDLLEAVREVVGAIPIVCTLDLHANLSPRRVALTSSLVGYHTNPHRDHAKSGARAANVLVRAARGEVRPTAAWRSLPMVLGGGTTLDLFPPMRAIYARCASLPKKDRRVLDASVFMVHPWLDTPEVGWSVHVTTDGEPQLASDLADELAEACWAVRHQQPPVFSSAADAVSEAVAAKWARRTGVVVMSDASDVVSAGSTGDSTRLLETLMTQGEGLTSYLAVQDPESARALFSLPVGARVERAVGGTRDPGRHTPLLVRGRVAAKREDPGFGKRVRLQLDPSDHRVFDASGRDGGARVHVVLVEGPALVMKPAFYREMGLRIRDADVVVVKNFFPFRLFFLPFARKTIYVRTGGVTDFDAAFALPRLRPPVHPRDPVDDWRAVDARRRATT